MIRRLLSRAQRRRRGQLVASAGGAVGGALVGGPPGAAAGQIVNIVASEIASRSLGDRERERVDRFEREAMALVRERLERGESPRTDDYFTPPRSVARRVSAPWGYPQPPVYELVEAGMMNAGRSYEERKVPYLAALTVALMFDGTLAPAYCHQLQQLGDRLSYRQLVCLAIFGQGYRDEAIQADDRFSEEHGIVLELDGLARDGLLGTSNPGAPADPTDHLREIGLAFISTTAAGRALHSMMLLDRIPLEHRVDVLRQLRATGN